MECFELVCQFAFDTSDLYGELTVGGGAVSALEVLRHSLSTVHYYSRDYNIRKTASMALPSLRR